MSEILDADLEVELHDVFHVLQVTRDTPLSALVGVDLVAVDPGKESSMHRHNNCETVLYFLEGHGEILLTEGYDVVTVSAGDRLRIGKGVFHAVRTTDAELRFLSVQSPPILDVAAGTRDLEPRPTVT